MELEKVEKELQKALSILIILENDLYQQSNELAANCVNVVHDLLINVREQIVSGFQER